MKNSLGLKTIPLHRLKVGEAVMLGPYSKPNTVSHKLLVARKDHPKMERWTFRQQQHLLTNTSTLETVKMYLLTRLS